MPNSKIVETLDRLSSKRPLKYAVYTTAIAVFFAFILLPPILGIITKWDTMEAVLNQPDLTARALNAVQNSFIIALLVSALDVITGIPMAWLIARGKSRWLNVLDTLADIPFIVPTVALGYSLLLFWSNPGGVSTLFGSSLISPGWLLVILLHFTFSYPVAVRVVVGAMLDYKIEYEQASRTLGAPPLTASRTVTFAIIKPSLVAAFVLSFSRSLSETGATFLVAGAFENGPVFIQNMSNNFNVVPPEVSLPTYEGSLAFASFILMASAIVVFALIYVVGSRLRLPVKKVWPSWERKLSYSKAVTSRNTFTLVLFLVIVLIPSLFVALPAFQAVFTQSFINSIAAKNIPGGVNWGDYWQSILLSYFLAGVVTVLNVLIGLPMAILIARKKVGKLFSGVLNVLVNVPLIVPSIALGVSMKFFWKGNFAFVPETLLLIFAHLSITYPYFVRSMSAATERISLDLEEASRTLGAKPLGVFRTIILPLTKYSILSGAIMVFTRSISETGATVAVVTTLKTAPVVLVDWVPRFGVQKVPASPLDIGLGCGYLILFSFIILLALRLVLRGRGRY